MFALLNKEFQRLSSFSFNEISSEILFPLHNILIRAPQFQMAMTTMKLPEIFSSEIVYRLDHMNTVDFAFNEI